MKKKKKLLVETTKNFIKYHQYDQDFALINVLGQTSLWKKKPTWKTIFVIIMTIVMVSVSTAKFDFLFFLFFLFFFFLLHFN
jgi:hypothetical protein